MSIQLSHPKIQSFIGLNKADKEFQKPKQKEITAIILYKRVIGSNNPDVSTEVYYYKQPITYKIKDECIKNWELTASIQRDEVALKECLDFDECLKKIKHNSLIDEDEIPVRQGAYTCIIYLLSSKFNEDYVKSPQPLTQDFGKSSWWHPFVSVEFGKKMVIDVDEVKEILSSGKSIGFMSEDFSKRFI